MVTRLLGLVLAIGCFLFLPREVFAQNCVLTGLNHTSVPSSCSQPCQDLKFQIPDLRSSSTYSVVNIPYQPYPYVTANGTEDPKLYNDDQYSAIFNLPFPFCFYDSVYSQAVMSSNGLVTFDTSYAHCIGAAWVIDSTIPHAGPFDCTVNDYPRASIMAAFMDIDPRPGPLSTVNSSPADRKIQWRVEGSAPCRRFVVSYYHIGAFQATPCGLNPDSAATFQIVMYESTGLIDIFLQSKHCDALSFDGTQAILGVQDFSRTRAVAAPGKNATHWTASNEGYRFVPSGGVSRFVSSELLSMNLTHIASSTTSTTTAGLLDLTFPNVCSAGPSTQYIVRTIFSACDNPSVQLTSLDTITVTWASPTAVVATPTAASCGSNNGTITIGAVTGGTAPYTFSVDGSGFTSTLFYNNLPAGAHTITVKDANGCTFSTNTIINNNGGPTAIAVAQTNASCGASNGTITIGAVTGGAAPYTFSIDGGGFTSTLAYNNLAPGAHTVTVKDANGCIFSKNVTIGNSNGPTAVAITPTAASCGANNGSITIGAVTGGTAPYTFTIDGGGFTSTLVYNNLAPGAHTVTVKDANGCTFSTSITINNNGGPTAIVVTQTNTSCGANNGTITIGSVTGGTSPYTFSIDGSGFTSALVYNNLAAGAHTIIVNDANGCTFSTSVTIGNTSGPTAVAIAQANASCGASNGTITIGAVTGGTPPYTFSIDGGGFTSALVYNNLAAGAHVVTLKDANGCTFSKNITIGNSTGPTAVIVTTTNASCGTNNGTITIGAVTGGTSPYIFSLDGGAFISTPVYNNLAPGPHNISVKDANGCTFSTNATINNVGGPTAVVVTATPASCGANNGTVTIGAVTGGTAPYTFTIDGGGFTSTLVYNNLAAGAHTITVKDANGCAFSTNTTINNNGGPTAVAFTKTNASCGANNGTITVGVVTGGTAPYTFSVDGSGFTSTLFYNNLPAGAHTITVKDANGCAFSTNTTINNNGGPTAVVITPTAASCGASNGTITIGAVTGGTAPYTFSLDGGGFASSLVYSNIAAGPHTITVKDANGCTFSTNTTINNNGGPTAVVVTPTNASCGTSNGTISIGAVAGGISPYTFSLDGGGFTSTLVYINLSAGPHAITVKDANGCTFSTNATINNTGGPTAVNITTTDASCGVNNGTITIGAVTGGTSPYTFSLDGSAFTSTVLYTNLGSGSHDVRVNDANGCTFSAKATINNVGGPTSVTVTPTDATCGASNGTITIGAVTGGTSPYTFSLDGSAFTTILVYNNLAPGQHTLTVKDANGCMNTVFAEVVAQAVLTIDATTQPASCNGAADGSITVLAGGGSSVYQYSIDGVTFQSSNSFNVMAGNYTVTVKDQNNCTITKTVTVGVTANLNFSIGNDTTICEGGSAQLVATTNATTVTWTPATGLNNSSVANPIASPTVSTQYTANAVLGGCSVTGTVTVTVKPAPVPNAGADADICFGENAQLSASGGATYQWTPSTYLSSATIPNPTVVRPQQTIQYTLQVKDANGCSSLISDAVQVKVTPPITVQVSPKDSVVAEGDRIQLRATSSATNYSWTNSLTLSDPNIPNPVATIPLESSGDIFTYTVTASTTGGCTGTASVTLKVYKGPDIFVPTAFTPNNDGKNDKFFPLAIGIKKINYFSVFNRWGQMVFYSTAPNEGWDGKLGGIDQPGGVYVWMVQGITNDDRVITKKGTVTLIR